MRSENGWEVVLVLRLPEAKSYEQARQVAGAMLEACVGAAHEEYDQDVDQWNVHVHQPTDDTARAIA